jgi:hypothetical protein
LSRHEILSKLCHLAILDILCLTLHFGFGGLLLGLLESKVNLFFVTIHDEIGANVRKRDILLVSSGCQDFVKGEDQIKGVFVNGTFLETSSDIWHDLGEKTECAEIFNNVGGLGSDQEKKHLVFKRLVDISYGVSFDEGVLLGVSDELGECGEQSLNAKTVNLNELTRHKCLATGGANASRKNNLKKCALEKHSLATGLNDCSDNGKELGE